MTRATDTEKKRIRNDMENLSEAGARKNCLRLCIQEHVVLCAMISGPVPDRGKGCQTSRVLLLLIDLVRTLPPVSFLRSVLLFACLWRCVHRGTNLVSFSTMPYCWVHMSTHPSRCRFHRRSGMGLLKPSAMYSVIRTISFGHCPEPYYVKTERRIILTTARCEICFCAVNYHGLYSRMLESLHRLRAEFTCVFIKWDS